MLKLSLWIYVVGKIIAIGGGEIGRPGHPYETTAIDKEIIKLTGKTSPRLLFIPTASTDQEKYYKDVQKHFSKELGCKTDCLYLPDNDFDYKNTSRRVLNSDIIYVGGGNTEKMIKLWKQFGLDRILREAYAKGVVLTGLSAGAICWFREGNSDSSRFHDPTTDLKKVEALGLVDALLCPHFISETDRQPSLRQMMMTTPGVAIAISNCCAIEISDQKYRIISSGTEAAAYKTYWANGIYNEIPLGISPEYKPLETLLCI